MSARCPAGGSPIRYRPDRCDHPHPNDAGAEAIARPIDLEVFR